MWIFLAVPLIGLKNIPARSAKNVAYIVIQMHDYKQGIFVITLST